MIKELKGLLDFAHVACLRLEPVNTLGGYSFHVHISKSYYFFYMAKEGESLEDTIKTYLQLNQANLNEIYKLNHWFIDTCVDMGWLTRKETIEHFLAEG